MRYPSALMIGTLSLLLLVSCNSPEAAAPDPAPAASPAATAITNSTPAAQASYPQLLQVVSQTQAAVTAGDFAKARQEFDQFEAVWKQVEDGIKEKAPQDYEGIEAGMDQVSAALAKAEADPATSALQALSDRIQKLPPS